MANLMRGAIAAAADRVFLSESLWRKKEREQRLEEYCNRPKVEAESALPLPVEIYLPERGRSSSGVYSEGMVL